MLAGHTTCTYSSFVACSGANHATHVYGRSLSSDDSGQKAFDYTMQLSPADAVWRLRGLQLREVRGVPATSATSSKAMSHPLTISDSMYASVWQLDSMLHSSRHESTVPFSAMLGAPQAVNVQLEGTAGHLVAAERAMVPYCSSAAAQPDNWSWSDRTLLLFSGIQKSRHAAGAKGSQAVHVMSCALELLLQVLPQMPRGGMFVSHALGALSALPSSSLKEQQPEQAATTASLGALLKVAAAEFSSVRVLSQQGSVWSGRQAPLPAVGVDAFGVELRGKSVTRPKLLRLQGHDPAAFTHNAAFTPLSLRRTWEIIGGLGALGLLTADWLAGIGHEHIVLLGRSGQGPLAFDSWGVSEVAVVRADTSLAEEVCNVLSTSGALSHSPPVAGVINSGGVLADAVLTRQTAGTMRTSFAPKLVSTGAMLKHVASAPVTQLVLFSSVSSMLGISGQANYAAANAALEGWMTAASAQGFSGSAVQWGAWAAGECLVCCILCIGWWSCTGMKI